MCGEITVDQIGGPAGLGRRPGRARELAPHDTANAPVTAQSFDRALRDIDTFTPQVGMDLAYPVHLLGGVVRGHDLGFQFLITQLPL
ncbi:hypothetical protein GCM10023217_10070 [Gordonia alkaliphila]|uniref:Uncharacterized protein n=1 Tax=Gordonia alkaliphila TaxID=1053547 RepID=A0ABP8Z0Y2_9ACTN